MKLKIAISGFTLLVLTACGGIAGGDGPGSGAFAAACNAQSNMPPNVCSCLEAEATDRLSPGGYAFITAAINEDRETTERLRQELGFQEIADASMFLVSGVQRCAINATN